jgi:hypothetical protein
MSVQEDNIQEAMELRMKKKASPHKGWQDI